MQNDEVTHDTPLSTLFEELAFGDGTIDQVLETTTLDPRL